MTLALAMILGAAAAPRAQEPAPDQSLERMRAVLKKAPLRIDLPDQEANFKIQIKAIHPLHEVFDKPLWQLDPIGWQPPAIGFNLLTLVRSAVTAASDAKHAQDARLAREEVQRAIADYCAVQPNANTIQICSTSPAIR
jgi:hypothetical protein